MAMEDAEEKKDQTESSSSSCSIPKAPSSSNSIRKYPRSWLRDLLSTTGNNTSNNTDEPSKSILHEKALTVAPMVDQSDLPFRLLCRRYGANLAFTPMIHARMFVEKDTYRTKFWDFVRGMPPEDRPLVAQFCGSDPSILVRAAKSIEHHVDAIDLNCGCPQGIARRGQYGAFLLEDRELLLNIVRAMATNLSVPFTVKVRLLPGRRANEENNGEEEDDRVGRSLDLYRDLVAAGASMITVHGRDRFQKGPDVGGADWEAIARVVKELGDAVPILANGGIGNMDDVRSCLEITGADGIMSSEAILEYPALFTETNVASTSYQRMGPGRIQLSREYLDLCQKYPPNCGGQGSGVKCARMHLHRFLHGELQANPNIRDAVSYAETYDELYHAVNSVELLHQNSQMKVEDERPSWYMRHREETGDDNQQGQSSRGKRWEPQFHTTVLLEDTADCMAAMFGDDGDDDDDDGEVCGMNDECV